MEKNILIIDNDLKICKKLKYGLQGSGYYAYYVCSEKEGLKHLFRQKYQLIIMETFFRKSKEFEFLSVLRSMCDLPIFIISSNTMLCDKVKGLSLGADDYLTKPFELEEVYARVNALIKRYTKQPYDNIQTSLVSRSFVLDVMYRKVKMFDTEIYLTKTEFDLLHLFMMNQEQVLTKEQIYERIWGDNDSSISNRLMCQIRGLRKKIEKDSAHPQFIRTIKNVGYLFQDN